MIGINVLTAIIIFACCHLPAAQSDNGTGPAGHRMPVRMRVWFVPDSVSYFSYDSAGQVCDHDISCDSIFTRALRRAADNEGGRITLQPGVYPLSVTLQLCSNLTLTGDIDAKDKALLKSHSPQTILEGDNISHTTLSHFGIRNSLDRGGEGILLHNGSCYNLINDIAVSHIGGNGIEISDSGSCYDTVRNSRIADVKKAGIAGYRKPKYLFIGNNHVIRTGDHGIILTGADNCRIKDNTVDSSGYYTPGGGNAFAHGIAIDGHSGAWLCSHDTIDGNTVTNSGSAGIEVADGVSHVVISHNYINQTGVTLDHDQYGIYFGGTFATGDGITIDHNEVYNCKWEGIRVGGNSIPIGNTDAVNITGNTVNTVARQGILLHYASNAVVDSNDVQQASQTGIELVGWSASYKIDGIAIVKNNVSDCTGPGLYIEFADDPVFTDNDLCDNGSVSEANGNEVYNVVINGTNQCLNY